MKAQPQVGDGGTAHIGSRCREKRKLFLKEDSAFTLAELQNPNPLRNMMDVTTCTG